MHTIQIKQRKHHGNPDRRRQGQHRKCPRGNGKDDHYSEGLMDMQQREPERWDIAETLMTLAQTLTDLANDANPV
jgi:hypothetical protein